MTLGEGLILFQKKNQKYFSEKGNSPEASRFLECHDVCHVLFGCSTTIYGEGIVKIWISFGSTLGLWRTMREYKKADAVHLAQEYSWGHILKTLPRLLISIPRALWRVRHMTQPWPFGEFEAYLDMDITDIRAEYGIEPLPYG